jgi:hypothetical protein
MKYWGTMVWWARGTVSGGVIAALNEARGWLQVLTFKERQVGERCEERPTIALGGRHWEPIVEEQAAVDLLRGLAAEGNAIEARIKAEIPDLAPSGDHDALEELLGLLRVTRGQRDDAWKEIAQATAQMKTSNAQLEELRQQLTELNASMQKPAEDKATLSLFPEQTPTEATALPSGAIMQSPKEAEAEAEKEPGQAS